MKIAEVAPFRIKINAPFVDDLPPDENGAGQDGKAKPDVLRLRCHQMAMAVIFAFTISHDAAGENDLDIGMGCKKIVNGFERAGQGLFVTVQIREDVAG